MATATLSLTTNSLAIPKLTHVEAGKLGYTEFQRVLAIVESLNGDDWIQPTDCVKWNVRDMVAHLAGACAGSASWAEFQKQMMKNPYLKEEKVSVDAVNRVQLEDRAHKTPEELIEELRDVGPKAVHTRQGLHWIIRNIRVPFGPPLGFKSIAYLTDTIYTRDQWMHRADLCRATGKKMTMTPEHDGRIIDLVVRDLAFKTERTFNQHTVDLHLTGDIDAVYHFGSGSQADVMVTMDIIEFNRLASGRISVESALSSTLIEGRHQIAVEFLKQIEIPY